MIKKTCLCLLALLLSFLALEFVSSLQKEGCKGVSVLLNEKNLQCPYKYEPYINIVYDFISEDISTKVAKASIAPNYMMIDDRDLHFEEGQEVVFEKTDKKIISKKPKIAIVIDDMGISHQRTLDIMSLKAPLTLAFLTYSNNLQKYFDMLEGSNFEIMAHIPMEAKTKFDEAPDTLRIDKSDKEIEAEFLAMLEKFEDIKFVNNHTGSLFTEDDAKMSIIMKILQKKNIGFLDSRTSSKSVGKKIAEKYGVDYLSRNVFLDNKNDFDYIMGQIKQTEKIAKKYGHAIAIAHPKPQTYKALKSWLFDVEDFEIVNLSDLSL